MVYGRAAYLPLSADHKKNKNKKNLSLLPHFKSWFLLKETERKKELVGMKGISKLLIRKSGKRRLNQSHLVLPCRPFSCAEINRATNNFDDNLFIGESTLLIGKGLAKVYKGFIDDPTNTNYTISAAIKRVDKEFEEVVRTEVQVLCQLRHPNIVRLIGYCFEDKRHCFLVYEFTVNGNLAGHDPHTVPWKQRLQICIGVARALHCLHTGLKHTIIHCNVKPHNILLNEKWEAKLSNFGESKIGPPSLSKGLFTIKTDRIMGTMGYVAPEYFMNREMTDKSDVYSLGVVLLQLLSGRHPFYGREEQMDLDLVSWARKCKREGNINKIIDPYLMGKIAPECFMVYVDIATSCVRNRGERRPTMGEVQVCLEHALELQESADAAAGDCNYCFDEYTYNDSSGDASPIEMGSGDAFPIEMGSGDASPIDMVWETASENTTSAEELSLETAMPNGQI